MFVGGLAAACGSGGNAESPRDGGGPETKSSAPDAGDAGVRDASRGHDSRPDRDAGASPDGDASSKIRDATTEGPAPPPPGAFPGQAGNPVGYEADPGYPGSLTKWTGSATLSASGTTSSPKVYSFQDFVAGTGGTLISGSHVKFVGCRFQSNDLENYNVQVTGSDVTFEYCSVTPLISLAPAPPHPAWPSGGAGLQLVGDGTGYQIDGNSGYEYGFNIVSGGPVTIDHCDVWGFGNAVVFYATTAPMTVQGSWIHDAADAAAQAYHTDGAGYLNGSTGPQNVSILGNTIASIGNTNGIAFQAVSSPYMNLLVSGNYLSGFGYTVDAGHETTGSTHMTFTNNVLGTDLPWVYGPIYGDPTTLYSQPTNTWSGNKLSVLAGTSPISGSWMWRAVDDGQFLWPDTTTHSTDF